MRIKYLTISLAITLALASCGNSDKENTNTDENVATDTTAVKETKVEPVKEFAGISDLAKKNSFTVEELNRALCFLGKKKCILVGYPYAYSQDTISNQSSNNFKMIEGKGVNDSKFKVKITFKNSFDNKSLKTHKLFAVKGTLRIRYRLSDSKWGNSFYFDVYDAEFVDLESDSYDKLTSLDDLDLSKPVFCGDLGTLLFNHFETFAKKDKIDVTGFYNGTTMSRKSDGTTIDVRVDLYDINKGALEGENPNVGCHMLKELTEEENAKLKAAQDNNKKVTIEGTFLSCEWFPEMKNCTIK